MLPSLDTIAERRRRLGITQTRLAELANVSQSYIAKLEANRIEPSYSKVMSILEVLEWLEKKREALASEIMTPDVVGIHACDPVQKAVSLMREYGYSQLPVFSGEKPVGSISERTIIDSIVDSEDNTPLTERSVSEIMDDEFPQVSEDTPISLLASLLKVYTAVLVSRRGEISGIVTKADLLKTLD